ncbi:MAG: transcriptional repressor [Clostridia bacterium]|nr:transcriptional repressor [Clostridia bacterium]
MSLERHSKQRDAILANLRSRKDHPTAQEVFFSLKPEIPALSLATVYRNLSMLANKGEIIRLQTAGEEHFDGDISLHSHFFCTECNKIYDIFSVDPLGEKTAMEIDSIGTITYQRLIFYGICRACQGGKN